MPPHDPQVRLRHMLEYGREAIGLMRDKTGVWSTITEDLPPLIAELEKIL
jgi:uncharacterized protein with HEPN domain